ncbi:MAG: DUF116 domain-containing protein [bacterium]
MRRFNTVNLFLFMFFIFWAGLIIFFAQYLGSWGLFVLAVVPLFVSVLFLNLLISFVKVLKSLFLVYPIMDITAKFLRLDFDKFRSEVIEYSNKNVMLEIERKKTRFISYKGSDILILIPHCIQNSECLYKVTWDKLENCRSCGKCALPSIIQLKKDHGLNAVVVGGGTAAREVIKKAKPKVIIAVACENDLISGLRDIRSIPIVAVLNQRSCGPCKNTSVDLGVIKSYIGRIIK